MASSQMLRLSVFLVFSTTYFGTFAAQRVHHPIAATVASFDVKGVRLGETMDELRAQVPDVQCPHDTCFRPSTPSNNGTPDSFAGHPTIIFYKIVDGKVAQISFAEFYVSDFESIVAAMKPKYGEPKIVSAPAQTRLGVKITDEVALWSASNGDAILFHKYDPSNIRYSVLTFYSADYSQQIKTKRKQRARAAQGDM